ncbi:MAG TPA: S66 peptidase family protein [Jatrophihabitans sp.]|uniref:S66 peptidase family protein n=1 Tax=Jatrophihabitans sp. TaxID=1932789 RepID=UPI002DFDF376|nr:S66 peptidase family protein [Jatrophihabitans sp.]
MNHDLVQPPVLAAGDRVAVVSPSFAVPAVAPAKHEQAMGRIRDELGLEPVEYPTTRQLDSTPADRARDLHAAFADPTIRAVLSTLGGEDQLTVLPHLDPAVFRADPKPFLGYSDNTNLLNWMWFHGLAGFHGGSTQVHLGRGGGTHPASMASLRAALFGGDLAITEVDTFNEDEMDWDNPAALTSVAFTLPSEGFVWHRPERVVTAPTWGGNVEILQWTLGVSRFVHPPEVYAGCVLLLETSEELPSADEVFRILRVMGERGLLEQFAAAVVARPKASFIHTPRSPEQRVVYRSEQKAAVRRAFERYNPEAMIVFDVDFGHTDPQWVLPYGGRLTLDGPNRRITAHFDR